MKMGMIMCQSEKMRTYRGAVAVDDLLFCIYHSHSSFMTLYDTAKVLVKPIEGICLY